MAEPPRAPWLAVILAQQRSGTNALRQTLAGGTLADDFGEVFSEPHPRNPAPVLFLRHRERLVRRHPEYAVPLERHQLALWRSFVGVLRKRRTRDVAMIDVKYGSWHHLDLVFRSIGDPPQLLKWVRAARSPVVHLIREDTFSQACSSQIAQARGMWEARAGSAPAEEKRSWELNPRTLLARMEISIEQTELFRRWFDGHGRYVELTYEQLFDGDRLSTHVYERLERATGVNLDEDVAVPLRKVTPPLGTVLENRDEIERFFRDTPFRDRVRAALET